MKLQLKKNFTNLDFFGAALIFFGIKYLYEAFLNGEIQIRAISINVSQSPLLYWVSIFTWSILILLFVFHLFFYDFKKQAYLLNHNKRPNKTNE
jgi:hypothetical protein